MTEQDKRALFNRVKGEILAFIEEMRKACPEAARYLEEHMVFDEQAMTLMYTGDDRLKMRQVGEPRLMGMVSTGIIVGRD